MSIEGISLEHFREPRQNTTRTQTSCCISLIWYDYSEHDAATTIAHITRIITLLNKKNIMSDALTTIWENKDDCAEH